MERCEVCGFAWAEVDRGEIARRVDAGTTDIAALIVADPERSALRPSPERWSATQYAAHVRDVLNTIRDRLVIGLVEDNPTFNAMYRDERVNLGLYDGDPAAAVADELRAATAMFIRLFGAVDPEQLGRPVQYGVPCRRAHAAVDGAAGGARGRAPPRRHRREPAPARRLTAAERVRAAVQGRRGRPPSRTRAGARPVRRPWRSAAAVAGRRRSACRRRRRATAGPAARSAVSPSLGGGAGGW